MESKKNDSEKENETHEINIVWTQKAYIYNGKALMRASFLVSSSYHNEPNGGYYEYSTCTVALQVKLDSINLD